MLALGLQADKAARVAFPTIVSGRQCAMGFYLDEDRRETDQGNFLRPTRYRKSQIQMFNSSLARATYHGVGRACSSPRAPCRRSGNAGLCSCRTVVFMLQVWSITSWWVMAISADCASIRVANLEDISGGPARQCWRTPARVLRRTCLSEASQIGAPKPGHDCG